MAPIARLHRAVFHRQMLKDRRGQSLVEFALAFPILLLMLVGIVDLGRGFRTYALLTNAAREGAQYGTFQPADTAGIRTKVTNALAGTGINIAIANACPNICILYPSGNASGNPIDVKVSYTMTTILGSIIGMNTIPIQGENQAVIF